MSCRNTGALGSFIHFLFTLFLELSSIILLMRRLNSQIVLPNEPNGSTSAVAKSTSLEEHTTAWSDDSAESCLGLAFRGTALLHSISHDNFRGILQKLSSPTFSEQEKEANENHSPHLDFVWTFWVGFILTVVTGLGTGEAHFGDIVHKSIIYVEL